MTAKRYVPLALTTIMAMTACFPPAYQVSEPVAVSTQIYFYPLKGQSAARQDRDRYDCYVWAFKKTGFDPSSPRLAPQHRYHIITAPGNDAAAGALAGAVIGSHITSPRRSVKGAAIGAAVGAIIGAASDAERQKTADELRLQNLNIEQQAMEYRRAMAACLQGRGYTVK